MIHGKLNEEQKEQITEWVEEHAEFEEGDLVTVDYDGEGVSFYGSEYGGIPLKVMEPVWHGTDVNRVSKSGLHTIKEHNNEEKLIKLFHNPKSWLDKIGKTNYATVKIRYKFRPAIKNSAPQIPDLSENSLIEWEEYDGDLVIEPRSSDNTVKIREGNECPICGFEAEKESHWHPGPVQAWTVSCAVCGYVKERHDP